MSDNCDDKSPASDGSDCEDETEKPSQVLSQEEEKVEGIEVNETPNENSSKSESPAEVNGEVGEGEVEAVPEDEDDDFGDFEDFTSFTEATAPPTVGSTTEEAFGSQPTDANGDTGWDAFGGGAETADRANEAEADWAGASDWTTAVAPSSSSEADANWSQPQPAVHRPRVAPLNEVIDEALASAADYFVVDDDDDDGAVNDGDQQQSSNDDDEQMPGDILSLLGEMRWRSKRQRKVSNLRPEEDPDDSGAGKEGENEDFQRSASDLWRRLRLIDESVALTYCWTNGVIYRCLLDALALDLKLAQLHRSSLPAFAPHLNQSVLVPRRAAQQQPQQQHANAKPKQKTSHEANGAVVVSSSQSASETSPLSSAAPAPVSSSPPPNHHPPPPQSNGTIDSLSVPPATFDWHKSGLNNPLTGKSVTTASTMLDLDFLAANDSKTGGGGGTLTAALQQDLAALGIGSSNTPHQPAGMTKNHSAHNLTTSGHNNNPPSAAADPKSSSKPMSSSRGDVSRLMQQPSTTTTTSAGNGGILSVSALTADAQSLQNRLPNLDYMLSSNLMFPLQQQSNNNDSPSSTRSGCDKPNCDIPPTTMSSFPSLLD